MKHKAKDAIFPDSIVELTVETDQHGMVISADGSDTDIVFDVCNGKVSVTLFGSDEQKKLCEFVY